MLAVIMRPKLIKGFVIKMYQYRKISSDIRNIGIMAHIDAGKTTTTERMLYFTGATNHMGNVDAGNTVTDYLPSEKSRGITVQSAAVTMFWNDSIVNLIDTPGHVDFTVEVERSLHVLDGAVAVFDAARGVQAQSKTVWKQAKKLNIPRIAFINKMDKSGANYAASIKSIKEKLNTNPFIIQIPLGEGDNFHGILDIVDMKKYTWDNIPNNDGTHFTVEDISKGDKENWDHVLIMREKLIEKLGDLYDEIANMWLDKYSEKSDEFPASIIEKYLKQATLEGKATPILCGSAFTNVGIQPLLDAIIDYLPSPDEISNTELSRYNYPKDLMIAYAFKVIHTKAQLPMVFTRMYSGELLSNTKIYNVTKDKYEEGIKIFKVFADDYQTKKHLHEGQIAAISGLKYTSTGDVLLGRKEDLKLLVENEENLDHEDHAILSPVSVPEPVCFCTIEVDSVSHQKELNTALNIICKEDPSVHVYTDEEYGQKIVSGMGELHIEVILERLTKEFKLKCYISPLRVAYREKPINTVNRILTYEREIAGKSHRVEINMEIVPNSSQKKVTVKKYNELDFSKIKPILNGIKQACNYGPILRYPVVGATIKVRDIVMTRSPPAVLSAAAANITKEILTESKCDILEPVMKVDITTSAELLDKVLGILAQKRADVKEVISDDDGEYIIHSSAPVAEMLGFSNTLRIQTSGNANLSMHLEGYKTLNEHEFDILKKKTI